MAEGGEQLDFVADLVSGPFSRRTLPVTTRRRICPPPPGYRLRAARRVRGTLHTVLLGALVICHGVWSHTGFVNVTCLAEAAARHQSTAGLRQASVLCKTSGESRMDLQLIEQVRRETELHNRKHRLSLMVDETADE